MNSPEEWLGHQIDRGAAKAPSEKRADRLVAAVATRGDQGFEGETRTRGRRQQLVRGDSTPCRGNAEHRRRRQWVQAAMLHHERSPWPARRDEPWPEAEGLAQF